MVQNTEVKLLRPTRRNESSDKVQYICLVTENILIPGTCMKTLICVAWFAMKLKGTTKCYGEGLHLVDCLSFLQGR